MYNWVLGHTCRSWKVPKMAENVKILGQIFLRREGKFCRALYILWLNPNCILLNKLVTIRININYSLLHSEKVQKASVVIFTWNWNFVCVQSLKITFIQCLDWHCTKVISMYYRWPEEYTKASQTVWEVKYGLGCWMFQNSKLNKLEFMR